MLHSSIETLPLSFNRIRVRPDLVIRINSINAAVVTHSNLLYPSFIDPLPYAINSRFWPDLAWRVNAPKSAIHSNSNLAEPSIDYSWPVTWKPISSPKLILWINTKQTARNRDATWNILSSHWLPSRLIISLTSQHFIIDPYSHNAMEVSFPIMKLITSTEPPKIFIDSIRHLLEADRILSWLLNGLPFTFNSISNNYIRTNETPHSTIITNRYFLNYLSSFNFLPDTFRFR